MSAFIEKVVREELDCVPEPCREKGPYLCYILRSVVAPARTYSGSTNDFPHRIKQHNGLLAGGAVMTKTTRPWRIAALVYGFTDRASALRYEWFTKKKHSKVAWSNGGQNSLQRRASVMIYAELKIKNRKELIYFVPDCYFRRCLDEARATGVPGTLEPFFVRQCDQDKTNSESDIVALPHAKSVGFFAGTPPNTRVS